MDGETAKGDGKSTTKDVLHSAPVSLVGINHKNEHLNHRGETFEGKANIVTEDPPKKGHDEAKKEVTVEHKLSPDCPPPEAISPISIEHMDKSSLLHCENFDLKDGWHPEESPR